MTQITADCDCADCDCAGCDCAGCIMPASPGGASELSPVLQRWEKQKIGFKSRMDGRVSPADTNERLIFKKRPKRGECPKPRRDGRDARPQRASTYSDP